MTLNVNDKPMVLMALATLVVTILAMWSYGHLHDSQSAANSAADDLAVCRRLAREVINLDSRPAMAHSQQIHLTELTRHIEQSTKQAKISPNSLVRIWPDPPMRVGDTVYQKKSTQVLFRQVTLRQIITFLHHVASQDGGPKTTQIRLSTPRGDETGNRWTAETTLTYLIYAPRIDKNS